MTDLPATTDLTPSADDLRAVRKRLCATIASGEANEDQCYAEMTKITKRIAEMEGNRGE